MLGHVGLELEVSAELAGAELAQVGAIDEDHLLALQLLPFILTCCGQGLGLWGTRQCLAQPYGESQEEKSPRRAEEASGQRDHSGRITEPLLRAPLCTPHTHHVRGTGHCSQGPARTYGRCARIPHFLVLKFWNTYIPIDE